MLDGRRKNLDKDNSANPRVSILIPGVLSGGYDKLGPTDGKETRKIKSKPRIMNMLN